MSARKIERSCAGRKISKSGVSYKGKEKKD
jgi:hypothetical protein